jgi:hypothetical protein
MAAFLMWSCAYDANKPANTTANSNAAKPAAAAPSVDTLFEMDKKANEAYIKSDSKYFEGILSDKFVILGGGQRMDKAATIKMIGGQKCDIKDGWKLEDPQMAKIDDDTYVISYKATFEGTCTVNGKTEKVPSPVRSASVWNRSGDKWLAVFHGENPIIDPKSPPPAPKPEVNKEEPAKNAKTTANTSAAPAKPAGDTNTDALVKIHNSGWEAWKNRDAKKLEELTAANLSIVDPFGGWHRDKADIIKYWTEGMKCEGVTTVNFGDGVATSVSPTVEILTGKGTANGTCDGQKNGDIYQTAFYVKEGDTWKLAFMIESMPMG